jgi:hypothetical protein
MRNVDLEYDHELFRVHSVSQSRGEECSERDSGARFSSGKCYFLSDNST